MKVISVRIVESFTAKVYFSRLNYKAAIILRAFVILSYLLSFIKHTLFKNTGFVSWACITMFIWYAES